jgi:Asp-tRNA(Asn)/Glu-tRNA(Gln) amidotransferase C subunit
LVIYAPYRGVSWSTSFQESEARALTRDISKIVKSIENSTKVLVDRVKEAERQAELRHQEWQAHLEKMRQDEDRRRVAQSIKESREQLDQVIQEWARIISLEQFFEGVRNRAQELPEEQRQEVMKRLELARAFVGTQDPLDFFRSWRMPAERYVPLSMQTSETKRGEEED